MKECIAGDDRIQLRREDASQNEGCNRTYNTMTRYNIFAYLLFEMPYGTSRRASKC